MRILRFFLYVFALAALAVIVLRLAYPLPDRNFAEPSHSLGPHWQGPLGRVIEHAQAEHAGLDGIYPLGDGREAFASRAVLAREAVSSIDVQYYIWQDDVTGLMLLDELRQAAERGVRVRLLLDDNGISGLDPLLAELDAMPSVAVRIFNPFTLRRPKVVSYLFDFPRLNRRMHNKAMIFDGVAAIAGGRNIGDIYFGYGEGTHYLDVDTIAIGPIAGEIATAFDAYWNSGSAYDAAAVLPPSGSGRIQPLAESARASAAGSGYQQAIRESGLAQKIAARDLRFEWADVTLFADDPAKGLGQAAGDALIVEHLIRIAAASKVSLDLVSAYFIPGDRGAALLKDLSSAGVDVRVLTNSLDATDVMPVHAAYMRYRKDLLASGVELLELRALRQQHRDRSLPELIAGSASGLHAKVFSFDGKKAFIGSFNLDPRSAWLNTEMGLLIESPAIARRISAQIDAPRFVYRVEISDSGALTWTTQTPDGTTATYSTDPETSWPLRALTAVVRALPVEWML